MALAAPAAVSEDNREVAFERFSERVMREGYRKFFASWIG